MSEQTVTDEDVQQTDIRGFLRKMRRGEPLSTEATSRLLNRIFNILEGLAGEGCAVDKPLDREGLGWRIVIDGVHSDLEPAGGRPPMPFELVNVNNAWHVWLKDAEVVVNNFHATRAEELALDGSGSYSAASFGAGSYVYLYVTNAADSSGVMHGPNSYTFNISTSLPADTLAAVTLGRVNSESLATQTARGNQVFYTFADSDIVRYDAVNAVVHLNTSSGSSTMPPLDDDFGFVVRHAGVLRYYKATDLLEVAFEKTQELLEEHDEGIWLQWYSDLDAAVELCMRQHGWPFHPILVPDSEHNWPYYVGHAMILPPPLGDGNTPLPTWEGVDDSYFRSAHLPLRTDLGTISSTLATIRAKLDTMDVDPDGNGPQQSLIEQLNAKVAQVESAMADLMQRKDAIVSGLGDIADKSATAQALEEDNQEHYATLQHLQDAIDDDVTALEGGV